MLLNCHLCRSTMIKSEPGKRYLKNGHFEEHQKKSCWKHIFGFFFFSERDREKWNNGSGSLRAKLSPQLTLQFVQRKGSKESSASKDQPSNKTYTNTIRRKDQAPSQASHELGITGQVLCPSYKAKKNH